MAGRTWKDSPRAHEAHGDRHEFQEFINNCEGCGEQLDNTGFDPLDGWYICQPCWVDYATHNDVA